MSSKGQGHSLTLVQIAQILSVEAKFYVEPFWDGEMKACSNDPGHMTKMVAMPVYDKNLKKSSSLEPKGR